MKTDEVSFDVPVGRLKEWIEKTTFALTDTQLEALAKRAILEHRRLTNEAEAAYEDCQASRRDLGRDSFSLKEAYRDLMERNRRQILIVSALTDRLGRIPEMSRDEPTVGE